MVTFFCTEVQNRDSFCFLYMPIHKYINIKNTNIYNESTTKPWWDMQIILEKKVIWNYFLITHDFYLKKEKDNELLLWLQIESCTVTVGKDAFSLFFDHI